MNTRCKSGGAVLKNAALALAILTVLLGPLVFRPRDDAGPRRGERSVVIVTPHIESIRYEFARGFERHHLAQTGERVHVDYRTPGGTSEIARYIAAEYFAAFQHYWTRTLGRKWSRAVELSFDNPKIALDATPDDDTPEQQARRAFLASDVSSKLDLFFGGGPYDFEQQARAGRLVDSGYIREHPELYGTGPGQIPPTLSGENFYDPQGRWIGSVLSSFGIAYNVDSLRRLGIERPPGQWDDLTDPRYFRQIALANPTQSGSVSKSFEMLIQQQMAREVEDRRSKVESGVLSPEEEKEAVAAGWTRALRMLMKIGANARYFTDSSAKIGLDVEAGEAAAGMTIDFYGRFQSEAVRKPDGSSRLQYANVVGGSAVTVDPIGLFRGAPNRDLAKAFLSFVLSPEGQKLWNWQVGAPGGPQRYALRRPPILPALYAPEFRQFRSDPDVDPYALAKTFTYREAWTAPLFRPTAFIFRIMCIDTHGEQVAAWRALIDAGFPAEAMAAFEDVSRVDYATAHGRIREALGGDKIKEVQLAKELADHFRAQYRRAESLARR
jgi:ABC-type Fe3+ transport system substrate-binding protein